MEVTILDKQREEEYDHYLLQSPETLLFASSRYKNLISGIIDAEEKYLVAMDETGRIAGALPCFLKKSAAHGNVLNSLPFYGSNGGIICHSRDEAVMKALLDEFYAMAERERCVATTLITSPFEENHLDFYERHTRFSCRDERIGQFTRLPAYSDEIDTVLMEKFHSKTRNMVRKAQKSGIVVKRETDEALKFIVDTHVENMKGIGGIPKPARFFEAIPHHFRCGVDYDLFVAYHGSAPVAALLLFYFNRTAEYFTPVIIEEYRSFQPLSLIIFEAMKHAAQRGFSWWNWGGTWLTQDGVYHFKSRWGTEDKTYKYYTRVFDNDILRCSREQLLLSYPFHFVVPFSSLVQ